MQGVDPRIEELHRLVASPDAPRRLHGFLRLEERLDELPTPAIARLLDRAETDPDATIVAVGRRLRRRLRDTEQTRAHPDGGRSVFEIDGPGDSDEQELLAQRPPRGFALGAEMLLASAREQTEALLLAAPPALLPDLIATAGDVRHPGFLDGLEARTANPHHAPLVAKALAGWQLPRARALLERLASETGPGQAAALEAMTPAPVPLLFAASKAGDPEVRAAAARGLGFHITDQVAPILRELLEDETLAVQHAAVSSWARQEREDVLEVLLDKLRFQSDDDDLRARIVAELRDHRSPEAEKNLVGLLRDKADRVRANAVEALGGYELSVPRATKLFSPLTADGTARVRGNAVLSLSLTHPPAATEALLEMFDCYETSVRQAAAYCAGMIQSPRATERLALLMRTEQSQEVLGTGLRALSKIRGVRAIEILQEFAARKSYGAVGVAAVDLLADLGQASAVPTLTRLSRASEDPSIRAACARAISRLASHQGLSHLPRLLADSSEEVVLTAVAGLEETGSLEAIDLLKPLLGSRVPSIQGAAITALWHLGEFSGLVTLTEQLEDKDESLVRAGLEAFGRIGRSLRVAHLSTKPVLRLALLEAFRRGFPEEAAALRRPAPPPPPPLPPAADGGDQDDSRSGPDQAQALAREAPLQDVPQPPPEYRSDPMADLAALRLLEASYDVAGSPPRESLEELSRHPRSAALLQVALRPVVAADDEAKLENLQRMALSQEEFSLTPLALLARSAVQRGDQAGALALQLKAAAQQTREATRALEAAQAALASGELDKVQSSTRILAGLLKTPPRLHVMLGDHALADGRFAEARSHFSKAFLAFPGEAMLALKLASAAAQEGHQELARAAAKAAYRRAPDGPEGRRARILLDHLNRASEGGPAAANDDSSVEQASEN